MHEEENKRGKFSFAAIWSDGQSMLLSSPPILKIWSYPSIISPYSGKKTKISTFSNSEIVEPEEGSHLLITVDEFHS